MAPTSTAAAARTAWEAGGLPTRAAKEESHTRKFFAAYTRWRRRASFGSAGGASWGAMGSAWSSLKRETNLTCHCRARPCASLLDRSVADAVERHRKKKKNVSGFAGTEEEPPASLRYTDFPK